MLSERKLWFGCVPTWFGEWLWVKKFLRKLHKLDNFRLAKSWVMKTRFLAGLLISLFGWMDGPWKTCCEIPFVRHVILFNVTRLAAFCRSMSTRCHSSLHGRQRSTTTNLQIKYCPRHCAREESCNSKLPIPSCPRIRCSPKVRGILVPLLAG